MASLGTALAPAHCQAVPHRPSSLGGEGVNFHPPAPALLPPGILVPSPWLLGYLCTFCTLSEKKLGVCMIFYDQNIFSDIAEIVFHPVNLHLVNLSVLVSHRITHDDCSMLDRSIAVALLAVVRRCRGAAVPPRGPRRGPAAEPLGMGRARPSAPVHYRGRSAP